MSPFGWEFQAGLFLSLAVHTGGVTSVVAALFFLFSLLCGVAATYEQK